MCNYVTDEQLLCDPHPQGSLWRVCFGSSNLIFAVSATGYLVGWNIASKSVIFCFNATNGVSKIAFNFANNTIVTCGYQNWVAVHDPITGKQIGRGYLDKHFAVDRICCAPPPAVILL